MDYNPSQNMVRSQLFEMNLRPIIMILQQTRVAITIRQLENNGQLSQREEATFLISFLNAFLTLFFNLLYENIS